MAFESAASRDGAGRRGWVRLSIHFLVRSLTLRASAFGLALLAVTIGAAVTAVMLNLKADLGAKMSTELRRYGPNLIVKPAAGTGATTLDEVAVQALSFGRIAPLLIASGSVTGPGGRPRPATIVGADFPALRQLNPSWRVAGDWPLPGDGTTCLTGAAADDCFARNAGTNPCGAVSRESFGPVAFAAGDYFFYVDSFYVSPNALGRDSGRYDLRVEGGPLVPVELLSFTVD